METNSDGKIAIHGDKNNPVYFGFSCIKGRESANIQNLPSRLFHSQQRNADGSFSQIDWKEAAAKVGDRLRAIIAEHGPRAVATYLGTYAYFSMPGFCMTSALMEALGSRMVFTSGTIDQPGKAVVPALHGIWLAGSPTSESWETLVLIGTNPLITMNGGLGPNPARQLRRLRQRGVKLIVIDPRETETAKQADIFLQCRPGTDAQILAGIARILICEGRIDADFIASNSAGIDTLTSAVEPFTPEIVAAVAGIDSGDLCAAARIIADSRSGAISAGTGANMGGQSTLTEYLIKVLTTLRGWWLRAGDIRPNSGALIEPPPPIAASPGPFPVAGFGENVRVRGLQETTAGMPTAALADEILTPGPGQVKALIVVGGNPVSAFPDQAKTYAAMQALELLICIDPVISETGKAADFIFAPKMSLEVQGCTAVYEWFGNFLGSGFGYERPYAQICEPVLECPTGSELAEDWEFPYAIAQHMGLPLSIKPISILDPARSAELATPVDMINAPSADDVWRMILKGAPISYDEVRKKVSGQKFDRPPVVIQDKPDGWTGRLELAAPLMMAELARLKSDQQESDLAFPFRLISRRLLDVINSSWHDNPPQQRKWTYNPAFMNPVDMLRLGVKTLDIIEISSMRGSILGVVESAPDVKAGCISMSHCWGKAPDEEEDPLRDGGSTSRLVTDDREFDSVTGIPRMSGIPVAVKLLNQPGSH